VHGRYAYADTDGFAICYSNANSYCYRIGYRYSYAHRDVHSDCDSHGHLYADGNSDRNSNDISNANSNGYREPHGNCYGNPATYADATAASDATAACDARAAPESIALAEYSRVPPPATDWPHPRWAHRVFKRRGHFPNTTRGGLNADGVCAHPKVSENREQWLYTFR